MNSFDKQMPENCINTKRSDTSVKNCANPSLAIDIAHSIILAAREKARQIKENEIEKSRLSLENQVTILNAEIRKDFLKVLAKIEAELEEFKNNLENRAFEALKAIVLSLLGEKEDSYQLLINSQLRKALNLSSMNVEVSVSPVDYLIFLNSISKKSVSSSRINLIEKTSLEEGNFEIRLGAVKISYNLKEQVTNIKKAILG